MPAGFERCMNTKGHRVVTTKPTKNTYRHICILGKKRYYGELKRNKKK